jgi:transposase
MIIRNNENMVRPWVNSDRGNQTLAFVVDPRDMLPSDHPVWSFINLVDEFDLSEFESVHRLDGQGQPPLEPRMMVTLIFYCFSKNHRSGRKIAAACFDDVGCQIITGGRLVGASTVNEFVRRHRSRLRKLLPQTLRIGHAEGLVDVSVVAGDGTYLDANAARESSVDEEQLGKDIRRLQRAVAHADGIWQRLICDQLELADHSSDQDADPDPNDPSEADPSETDPSEADSSDLQLSGHPGGDLQVAGRSTALAWRRLQRCSGELQWHQGLLAQLAADPGREWRGWAERMDKVRQRVDQAAGQLEQARAAQQQKIQDRAAAKAGGRRISGTDPVPVEQHVRVRQATKRLQNWQAKLALVAAAEPHRGKINKTDPGSALMPGKRGGYRQRYNIQMTCTASQFILSAATHPSTNDKQALKADLAAARANLDAAGIATRIGTAMFDAGYASAENFTADLPVDKLLVAV